jgi:hypothetical protein
MNGTRAGHDEAAYGSPFRVVRGRASTRPRTLRAYWALTQVWETSNWRRTGVFF